MSRRTNWNLRQRIERLAAAIVVGDLSVREAAEEMRAHLVPLDVALRVVRSVTR